MITKPTLFIDEHKCKLNIANMFARSQHHKVEFRPHFKTHQSLDIGQWFIDAGVSKITVSSLDMAEYFAEQWNDITVAFPVNILEIATINKLASRINLNVLIESEETAKYLVENLRNPVNFLIKINIGNNRAGLLPTNTSAIEAILKASNDSNKLTFIGFLGHAGQTYKCRTEAAILEVHNEAKAKLIMLKQKFKIQYPKIIASYGDTPSCSVANDFSEIDEIRPGNFAFYDVTQEQIGSCTLKEVSVAMLCPIVAIHEEINEIVIYGGGIHFSKDRIEHSEFGTIYGLVVKKEIKGWTDVIPKMYVRALSQEHGVVKVPDSEINNYSIGDTLLILPVHSCMTADLMKKYKTLDGKNITMLTY